jgi:hypothetical protein
VAGAQDYLGQFSADLIRRKLVHYPRALFTLGGLALAALGALSFLVGPRSRELRRPGSLWLGLGLCLLGLGYTLPFPRGVLVHQFWMMVFLPWISFLIAAAVHAWARGRVGGTLGVVALLVLGGLCARQVLERQALDRSPYYAEFGEALRTRTREGEPVLTSEKPSAALKYYSWRDVQGNIDDRRLAGFLASGEPVAMPTTGWFAVVDPPIDPPETRSRELLEFLGRRFEADRIPLEGTGSVLWLFDFSRPLDRGSR